MPALLTVPVLTLALAFPGFGFKSNRSAAPADTIPVPWKSPSLLALENDFVIAGLPPVVPTPGVPVPAIRMNPAFDPRRVQVSLDADSGTIGSVTVLGDSRFPDAARIGIADYSAEMSRATFRRLWQEKSRQNINRLGDLTSTSGQRTTGFRFELPSPLPKRVQSWLGPGGPALNVSGTENIKLSGQSDWSNQTVPGQLLGQRKSLFPTLNMQQDLDIRLEGQLSDRIRVNLLQNSANQIPLANKIAINYKGDEDDLIQALDLGNTNLTLPGTQFVSYSGRNEGLFGVKASSRFGPLDVTVLASKQEGKSERASYAGGSSSQEYDFRDFDYVRRRFFFLYDPNLGEAWQIDPGSIQVFLDDGIVDDNTDVRRARATVDPMVAVPDSQAVFGQFVQLVHGTDYEVDRNLYGDLYLVLRMKNPVAELHRLAVSYARRPLGSSGPYDQVGTRAVPGDTVTLSLKLISAPKLMKAEPGNVLTVNFDADLTRSPLNAIRELELKNIYQLQGQGIDLNSFKLSVRRGPNPDQPETEAGDIPYLEIVGLDSQKEVTGTPQPGQDLIVDRTLVLPDGGGERVIIDAQRGLLMFFDPRPFAPRLDPATHPFDAAIGDLLNRRAVLDNPDEGPRERNVAIYDQYNPTADTAPRYWMDVSFNAQTAQGEINLGRGNLLEGSEVVTVGGQTWQRDRDYSIDYDLGRVVLKRAVPAGQALDIDFSYAPLFQQAGRTLLGSAFRLEGRDKAVGGAFMYESKGAQDLRPRLGEEPSRSLIGDLNTEWTFRPDWMTRMVDRLPFLRTTAPSELRVQAEVGMSFPNPNTRNEVFIDDMEGVRDAVSLSMSPEAWAPASVPRVPTGGGGSTSISDPSLDTWNAEMRWYSPISAVQEYELRPDLDQAEGGNNYRQVLALSVPQRPDTLDGNATSRMWAGVTYPLDRAGIDLSRSQFIEIWVNDFADLHVPGDGLRRIRGNGVKLMIDLGTVSEDQMRSPDVPPNSRLDTEDSRLDDQLELTEDTGVDGVTAETTPVRDLITATPADPEGDNFTRPDDDLSGSGQKDRSLDPRSWRGVNGTEGNREIRPIPDTEDFNRNGAIDTEDNYFQWTIDLGDTASPYLVTDVQRDYPPTLPDITPPAANNGWRRYRLPITEQDAARIGLPNLALTQHLRLWLRDMVEPDGSADPIESGPRLPMVMIGGLEIVGSRWRQTLLTPDQEAAGTTATLNSVNTIDHADVYTPPFDPGDTRSNNQAVQRREQSVSLEFTQLAPDDTVEAFKTFSLDEDYSRYGKLNWYAAAFEVPGYDPGDSLMYYVRFGTDLINKHYYEYRAPLPPSSAARQIQWQQIELALTDLSNLKLRADFPSESASIHYEAPGRLPGETWIVHGRPSFTRLRRISFGLVNRSSETFPRGQLWFNELRATDVARDVDQAQRVIVNGRLANLLRYDVAWNGRGADFLSVGQSRGLGTSSDQLSASSTIELHRFFESSQISLPVSVNYARHSQKPRFTAGDDVVRSEADQLASETRSETRTYSTSYARTWSDRSNPLLRYSIGGITAGITHTSTDSRRPTGTGNGRNTSAVVGYAVSPRRLLPVPLGLGKLRLFPLPENVYWNYSTTRGRDVTYQRVQGFVDSLRKLQTNNIRTGTIDFGATTRPFGPDGRWADLLSHRFQGRRNLTLDPNKVVIEELGPINLGRVVSWNQSFSGRLGLERGDFLRPLLTWGTQYHQNNGPELSEDLSVRAVSNSMNATLGWEFPFERLASVRNVAAAAPVRVRAVATDSTGAPLPDTAAVAERPRGPGLLRTVLSRLGTLQTDLTNDRSSGSSRVLGTPSLGYLFGVSSDPETVPDTSRVAGSASSNIVNQMERWRGSARNRITLMAGASLNSRFEWTWERSLSSGITDKTISNRFPDFEVEYGKVATLLRLDRVLQNPRLRTQFVRSQVRRFQNNRTDATGIGTSGEWRPLIGVTGDLKGGTRLDLRVERRSTDSENRLSGLTIDHSITNSINLSLNRSFSRGQKVQFLGRTQNVNSSVNLGFTAVYDTRNGGTDTYDVSTGQKLNTLRPVDESRLSLNATGSYGFSNNVTGNIALGYGRTNDRTTARLNQNLRVELRAQFTF